MGKHSILKGLHLVKTTAKRTVMVLPFAFATFSLPAVGMDSIAGAQNGTPHPSKVPGLRHRVRTSVKAGVGSYNWSVTQPNQNQTLLRDAK
jgi:hypothetical protein